MVQYTKDQIAQLDKYYSDPKNLVDLFEKGAARWGNKNAIGQKDPATKEYKWITFNELQARINNVRGALSALGLKKGESVGVILSNSIEWYILENATHGMGACFVPMYEKELVNTWKYIIRDSALRFLFVRDSEIYDKVKGFTDEIKTLKDVYLVYGDGAKSLAALEESGAKTPVESYKPHWSEIAELIYTSGTTGDPKGVLLSHGNLTACTAAGVELFPELGPDTVVLSILPWAHSYALSAELHSMPMFGGSIAIMESIDTLAQDMLTVRPNFLIAVPRIFNKIYSGIKLLMESEGGLKKKLFDATCAEAKKCRGKNPSLKLKLLDKIVFEKIRARFGGRLKGAMTASALMNPGIAEFFKDLGIPTFDCYGLTETAPAITMNSTSGNKYGTVGKPIRNMHVKIDKSRTGENNRDGEIVAYGAHVMMGYHNKPEQTAAIMVEDTWNGFPGIRTGDIGCIDEDGYLCITGRYKDEYKLANGKYVHPESIETDMKLIPLVANAFVYGEGKEYNVALVVPDFERIRKDPQTAKFAAQAPNELIENREFQDFLNGAIAAHLKKTFGGYEVPRKTLFIAEDFTRDNGMLTQTLKLVRREVMKNYGDRLMKLYAE
ncbi:MAG TPA: AMP-binding protein [Spirochaetota bacterium]|nr:AMP-binding protein [Spirochaetota bacterium]HOD16659.1 AMP-binding protein [Spirochaetota bacterium]HPG50394.1 AMP-binding protein [Spirochaetota bacterium]HPN12550.1 AMP-binding protein [Spirochaetota bacterium]